MINQNHWIPVVKDGITQIELLCWKLLHDFYSLLILSGKVKLQFFKTMGGGSENGEIRVFKSNIIEKENIPKTRVYLI